MKIEVALSRVRRLVAAVTATVLGVVGAVAAGVLADAANAAGGTDGVAPAASVAPMTAAQLTGMFRDYGDRGLGWTGGDSTVSVPLPDGRVAWLFADTFLGTVNPDGSRPDTAPMVNNTLVVQDGSELVETRTGGSAGWPQALVTPEQPGEFFWVADGLVEDGELRVLYNRYARFGAGGLDVEVTGTSLATFTLPDLTLSSVTDLPVAKSITWGAALLADGPHTYVYGTSAGLGGLRYAHVARADAGDLGGPWEYWTGSTWSGEEGAAARVMSGVGTSFGVTRIQDQYVLVTQETNAIFDPQVVAYTASGPVGPFTGPAHLLTAPEQQPGEDVVIYTARLHQELARPGKLLLSYDVNSLDNEDVYADARLYRPRFVELDWPRPDPGPVPDAPDGLAASPDPSGVVDLSWQPVAGAEKYYVHYRDLTAGQTHFYRRYQSVTGAAAEVPGLITGHRYEFRVTAANAAGQGSPSGTVAATARIVRDAGSIIRHTGTPEAITDSYIVELRKTPAVRDRGVEPVARELLGQSNGTLGHVYERVLTGFSATLTEAQAVDLAGHPDVVLVEQAQRMASAGAQGGVASWGLDRIDQRNLPLDQLYSPPNHGSGVRVYVVDSGVRTSHDAFGDRATWGTNTTGDGIDRDCTDNGHGTHVAGTVGGAGYGVAREVELVAVKVTDCDNWAKSPDVVAGLEWVREHRAANRDTPAVVNMSVLLPILDTRVDTAVKRTVGADLPVVVAAGNSNRNACSGSPSGVAEAIVVAATNRTDHRGTGLPHWSTGGSNFGQCLDLFAPGEEIVSATNSSDSATKVLTGTSMAAPHVTGAVAMVLAAHPDLSPKLVEQLLVDAATPGVVEEPGPYSPNRLLFLEKTPIVPPTNLAATAEADGTIGLSWDSVPVPDAGVFYVVFQRDVTAGETSFTRWEQPVLDGTTAVASGLAGGHEYEFAVAAATTTGVGPRSAPVRAVSHIEPPPAPADLTATANQDGTVTLDWTAPAPDLWYWVYQRDLTAEETEFTQLPLPLTDCCTFTAGLLAHDHEYEFVMTSVNEAGESAESNPARARAQYPPTAAPGGLRAVAGDGEVALTWEASRTPNVWYWVYQRDLTAEETEFTQLPLPLTDCCAFTAGYLANGHEYEFKVTAIGPAGESGRSNLVRATPLPPKPAKVTGLTATAQADGTVRLTWDRIDRVYFWILQRDVTAGEGFTRVSLPTEQTSFTAGLLTHDHVYEFRVLAENVAGEGPASDPARATSHYQPPGRPGNLQAVTSGDGYIDLDWTPPGAGGFYYWIYHRDVTAGQTSFTRSMIPTDRTSARSGPFVHGHEYEFKVSAESPGGEGPASAPVRATSRGGLPLPPSGLSATAGNGQVTLRWSASPSPDVWYWIEFRPRGGAWQRIDIPVTTCCANTVRQLANGTTYDFRLRATNSSGDSRASNVATARPMPPLPRPPSGLSAAAGDGQVTLRWSASPSPDVWYWVEYRTNGGAWQRIDIPVTTCCTNTVRYLTNGANYEFRLRATNLSGDSAASNVATARPMPPRPGAPTNLTARSGDGEVTLHWAASPSPDVWYWIEHRPVGGAWQRLAYPLTSCCGFTVSYLSNGTTYEFRVRATNLAGDGPPSNVARATPQPAGRCDVFAGNPIYWGYNTDVYVMQTRASAIAACYGPVADVEVSVTLYPVPADDPRNPTTTTSWWGHVGHYRDGTISVSHNAYAFIRCLGYVTQAKATWTVGGSPRAAVVYSPTVNVGPDCVPPA